MGTATRTSPEITRAAERYLEQYGDPLVMNTYLKVTILVLCVVCLALAALVFKSQKALASMHPMIVRINDVGRAEAIDYRNFQYRPQEAENKYYLSRWAELYFARNRFEDDALRELADSIRSQGVLSPLLVRPLNERSFEIVAGARRYRAAQLAEAATVPVRIVNLTDAEALEAQLVELSIVGKSFRCLHAVLHIVYM